MIVSIQGSKSAVLALVCAVALAIPSNLAEADARQEVDVQLVLAADASGSMGRELSLAQRKGFVAAFRDPALRDTILSGPLGRIAITYFEWSDEGKQRVVVPWRLIDDAGDMADFADALAIAEVVEPGDGTSISGALLFAERLIAENAFRSHRKVIDVSGDGPNNAGPNIVAIRKPLRAAGITVNGLVMNDSEDTPYWYLFLRSEAEIVAYYRRFVRQGPGAFVVAVENEADFTEAILRKLVLEIAWNR